MEREEFEADCRKLVQKEEIKKAKRAMQVEDQRMVAEGDRMWARGEGERRNINEMHVRAAARLGQEKPWAYIPLQLLDCPGCGGKIKENIITCTHCGGYLDEGIPQLAAMHPRDRRIKMYPNQLADPVGPKGK